MFGLLFLLLSTFSPDNDNSQQPTYQCNRVIETEYDFTCNEFWQNTEWTSHFVDLKTGKEPTLPTRTKMLWDNNNLYIMAEMADHHLWAVQTENEGKIYLDNAFELFVDPDGDGLNYIEYEINALGTSWDLLMAKPYRDGGDAISSYDMRGVEKKIILNGTLNNPGDIDTGWVLYLTIPFENFRGLCPKPVPATGDTWRMNLVRVHWELDIDNGTYIKSKNPETDKNIAKYWVWSPHGVINMHKPESFDYVLFM